MEKIKLFLFSIALMLPLQNLQAQGLSTSFALVSNYKSRGLDQTQNQPAIHGGVEYQWKNGFYIGNWNSTANWDPAVNLETDFYGGYRGEFLDINYFVSVFRYGFPGHSISNTVEMNFGISHKGFELKYSKSLSDLFFSSPIKAGYLNIDYTHNISDFLTTTASIGRTNYSSISTAYNPPNYTDLKLTLDKYIGDGYILTLGIAGANNREFYGQASMPRLIVGFNKTM